MGREGGWVKRVSVFPVEALIMGMEGQGTGSLVQLMVGLSLDYRVCAVHRGFDHRDELARVRVCFCLYCMYSSERRILTTGCVCECVYARPRKLLGLQG